MIKFERSNRSNSSVPVSFIKEVELNDSSSNTIFIDLKSYIESLIATGLVNNESIELEPNLDFINSYGLLFIVDTTVDICMTHDNCYGNSYKLDELEDQILNNTILYLNEIDLNNRKESFLVDDYFKLGIENVFLIHKGYNVSKSRLSNYESELEDQSVIFEHKSYD